MVKEYSKVEINNWIEQLKNGDIKSDHTVDGEYGDISLLQAVLNTKMSVQMKYKKIKELIELGCDVDQFHLGATPISQAVTSNYNEDDYKNIVNMMLQHHTKGHMSDFNILKSCLISFDDEMFEFVVKSNKVDTNTTRSKGTHILHALAEFPDAEHKINSLFKYAPDTHPNPINRKGFSPLAISINKQQVPNSLELLNNKNTKIIGKIEYPEVILVYEMIDRYEGNFFKDYPEMIKLALKVGKTNMLPKEATDVFIF